MRRMTDAISAWLSLHNCARSGTIQKPHMRRLRHRRFGTCLRFGTGWCRCARNDGGEMPLAPHLPARQISSYD